jgi:TonB family protein
LHTLPPVRPTWQTGAAAVLSGLAHILVIASLVSGPGVVRIFDDSKILPALYLYAHDRIPSEQRESRLPIPAPPGNGEVSSRAPAAQQVDRQSLPQPARVRGLVPPGLASARLDSVFTVLGVDSEVVRMDGSAAPAYPNSLLNAGIEGYVEAEFVVDTTGWVDLSSVRILNSTHQEFASSVRLALMGMRFRPAWRGARKVRQLVSQRFTFRMEHPMPATTL